MPPPLFAENGFRLDGFCLNLAFGRSVGAAGARRANASVRHKINSRESVDKEKWIV